jgi:hypothetical protein
MSQSAKVRLRIDRERETSISLGNTIPVLVKDYEKLDNLPQINGQTLIGNKLLSELIGDVLILDGGTAEEVTA